MNIRNRVYTDADEGVWGRIFDRAHFRVRGIVAGSANESVWERVYLRFIGRAIGRAFEEING